jgi:hypothetical protein
MGSRQSSGTRWMPSCCTGGEDAKLLHGRRFLCPDLWEEKEENRGDLGGEEGQDVSRSCLWARLGEGFCYSCMLGRCSVQALLSSAARYRGD